MKRLWLIAILTLVFVFPASCIELSPDHWDIGYIGKDNVVFVDLVIANTAGESIAIEIIPTCDCIFSDTGKLSIEPKEKKTVRLFLNPKDEEPGEFEKYFFITFPERKDLRRIVYKVTGTVAGTGSGAMPVTEADETAEYDVEVWLFYFPGCKTCENLLASTFPALEKKLSVGIKVNRKDLNDLDVLKEYESVFAQLNEKERDVPVLLVGRTLLQGGEEIKSKMESVLVSFLQGDKATIPLDKNYEMDAEKTKEKLSIFAAIGSGLADGINPCAFATLISLLTALTLAGRKRVEILFMGVFFSLAVFASYFLIGLGFFIGLKAIDGFPIVSIIIRWVLFAVLIVFSGLSLYDYYLIRHGRTSEMVLQLPDFFKKQIQKSIKTQVRSAALVLSSLVLGVLITIFELGCTGQIYVPVIRMATRLTSPMYGLFLIFIYNIAFIVPLVSVFIITYFGLSSKRLLDFFQKHMGKTKIALAVLFLGLAALTIWL